jgi:hypothetical protein
MAHDFRLKLPRPVPVLGPYLPGLDQLLVETGLMPRKQSYLAHQIFNVL